MAWVDLEASVIAEFEISQIEGVRSIRDAGLAVKRNKSGGKYDRLKYLANREVSLARARAWQTANRERVLEYKKRYRKKYKPTQATLDKRKAWRMANKARLTESQRKWRAANLDRWRPKQAENTRKREASARAAGLCKQCCKVPSHGMAYCEGCRAKRKAYYQVRKK